MKVPRTYLPKCYTLLGCSCAFLSGPFICIFFSVNLLFKDHIPIFVHFCFCGNMMLKHQNSKEKANSVSAVSSNEGAFMEQIDKDSPTENQTLFKEILELQHNGRTNLIENSTYIYCKNQTNIQEEEVKFSEKNEIEEVYSTSEIDIEIFEAKKKTLLKDLLLLPLDGEASAQSSSSPTSDAGFEFSQNKGIAGIEDLEKQKALSQQYKWLEDYESKEEALALSSLIEPKGGENIRVNKSKWREKILSKVTNVRKQPTPLEVHTEEVEKNIAESYKKSILKTRLESERKKTKTCWDKLKCCSNVEVIKGSKRKQPENWIALLEKYIPD